MLTRALLGPVSLSAWEAALGADAKSKLTGQNGGQASCSTRQAALHPQPRLLDTASLPSAFWFCHLHASLTTCGLRRVRTVRGSRP